MNLNKIALALGMTCILLATTVSIAGIWGFIGDTGLVWRSLSTLGVVFLGVVLTMAINSMTNNKEK